MLRRGEPKPVVRPDDFAEQLTRRVAELETAFSAWQTNHSAGDELGFSLGWLRTHGFSGLEKWLRSNDALADALQAASPLVRVQFEQRLRWNPERLQTSLAEAHAAWRLAGANGEFGRAWLRDHEYSGFEKYVSDNDLWKTVLGNTAESIRSDFRTHESPYTLDTAIAKLKAAHAIWQQLDPSTRAEFTPLWCRNHGFGGLEAYLRDNYPDLTFVALLAGEAVGNDFREYPHYNLALALDKLTVAHAAWQAVTEADRGNFSPRWLQDNGFGGLDVWIRHNYGTGGYVTFVHQAPQHIQQDFRLRGEAI